MTGILNVFGRYRQWVEEGLAEICPYSRTVLEEKTGKIIFVSFTASVLGMSFVLILNGADIFTLCAMAFVAYIMLREIPEILTGRLRNLLYAKLPAYFAAVRKKYMNLGNIPEAVKEAAAGMDPEIRNNAEEIYDILLLGNRREKVREYAGKGIRNRFLKLFLIQAYEASEFGDGTGEKKDSVFAENIDILRAGVTNELYTSRKTRYMFSGYMTVAVLPVLLFGAVRKIGLSFSKDMLDFYGGNGKAVLLSAFLTAFFIYRMVSDAGKAGRRSGTTNGHSTLLRFYGRFEDNSGAACTGIRKLLFETASNDTVASVLFKMTLAFSFPIAFGLISGVHHTTGGRIMLPILGLISGVMPILELLYKKARNRSVMVEEIKRMQMVLVMERRLESITVTTLLSDLELFAEAFGPEIRECLNTWSAGPEAALRTLKEKGRRKNPYFESIADGFLCVDEVGTEEAFADIVSDRESMVKMEELENTIMIENRKNITDIMAWLPGVIMLGGYFILPFLKLTLAGMEEMFDMLGL